MEANSKDLGEFARLALRFRLLAPPSIVAWADALIADRDIPAPWLIDLALAKPDTIDDALKRVPGEAAGRPPDAAVSRSAPSSVAFGGPDNRRCSRHRLAAALRIGAPCRSWPSGLGCEPRSRR